MHKIFICERLFSEMIKECVNCKTQKEHHAKGLCYMCYKKLKWQPKLVSCKRCRRKLPLHAKKLCASCYNSLFHSDKSRQHYHRKSNNIDLKTYRKVTKECAICSFDKIVDVHHIDSNKENNSLKNLVGLCPNHHRMINNSKFRQEIFKELEEKGFDAPLNYLSITK